MDIRLTVGIGAGCLTAIAATPQIIKALKTKNVKNISPVMFVILMAGNALWIWYGSMLEDWPIIITNGFSLLMDLSMLALKFIYGKKKS